MVLGETWLLSLKKNAKGVAALWQRPFFAAKKSGMWGGLALNKVFTKKVLDFF
ncbi:MAG: hypothetical protein ACOYJZ_08005 [Acutalibacter sp.]|jgi:hypothetical protein